MKRKGEVIHPTKTSVTRGLWVNMKIIKVKWNQLPRISVYGIAMEGIVSGRLRDIGEGLFGGGLATVHGQ
jgi:hypothetical protein